MEKDLPMKSIIWSFRSIPKKTPENRPNLAYYNLSIGDGCYWQIDILEYFENIFFKNQSQKVCTDKNLIKHKKIFFCSLQD